MLIAWTAATNRCALTALFSAASAKHECCAEKIAREAKQQPAKRSCECCQELGALPVKSDTGLVKMPVSAVLFELAWALADVPKDAVMNAKIAPATGPPEARSFAELVLQRSLRSLAPPSAA